LLGIGGTLCDASLTAIEGVQIHQRHGRMGVTTTLAVVVEKGTLGGGCGGGRGASGRVRWWGERYGTGTGGGSGRDEIVEVCMAKNQTCLSTSVQKGTLLCSS
jgi:hypothetical protein